MLFGQPTYDRLLNSLVKIGAHSPAFLIPFYVRLFGILPPLRGEFKVAALSLVLLNVDDIHQSPLLAHPSPSLCVNLV